MKDSPDLKSHLEPKLKADSAGHSELKEKPGPQVQLLPKDQSKSQGNSDSKTSLDSKAQPVQDLNKASSVSKHSPAPAHNPTKLDDQHLKDHTGAQGSSKDITQNLGKDSSGKTANPKKPAINPPASQRKARLPQTLPVVKAPATSSPLSRLTDTWGTKLTGMAKGLVKEAATSIAQDLSKQVVAVTSEYASFSSFPLFLIFLSRLMSD